MPGLVGHDLDVALRAVEIGKDEGHLVVAQHRAVAAACLAGGGQDIHQPIVEHFVEKYFKEHFMKATIEVFFDGDSLCKYLQSSPTVNLLFLDIELPKCNGVKVGKYIREELENEVTEIIYISSKTNYAMKLFQ